MPFDVKGAIPRNERVAGPADTLQKRPEIIPEFSPVFAGRPAYRARVLVADGRRLGVVVERNEIATPEQHNLCLGP